MREADASIGLAVFLGKCVKRSLESVTSPFFLLLERIRVSSFARLPRCRLQTNLANLVAVYTCLLCRVKAWSRGQLSADTCPRLI